MLHAYGKNIICKPIYEEKKGGLILTANERKPLHYEVTSVGDEVKLLGRTDKVIIRSHMFQEIKYQDETYLVMDESAVLAKIEE